jgi:hypothetical protein
LLKCLVATATGLSLFLFVGLFRALRARLQAVTDHSQSVSVFRRLRRQLPLATTPILLVLPSSGVVRRGPPVFSF